MSRFLVERIQQNYTGYNSCFPCARVLNKAITDLNWHKIKLVHLLTTFFRKVRQNSLNARGEIAFFTINLSLVMKLANQNLVPILFQPLRKDLDNFKKFRKWRARVSDFCRKRSLSPSASLLVLSTRRKMCDRNDVLAKPDSDRETHPERRWEGGLKFVANQRRPLSSLAGAYL